MDAPLASSPSHAASASSVSPAAQQTTTIEEKRGDAQGRTVSIQGADPHISQVARPALQNAAAAGKSTAEKLENSFKKVSGQSVEALQGRVQNLQSKIDKGLGGPEKIAIHQEKLRQTQTVLASKSQEKRDFETFSHMSIHDLEEDIAARQKDIALLKPEARPRFERLINMGKLVLESKKTQISLKNNLRLANGFGEFAKLSPEGRAKQMDLDQSTMQETHAAMRKAQVELKQIKADAEKGDKTAQAKQKQLNTELGE